ncbi:hypothetical protein NQ315_013119 [Exocentrus adspersus]|uniref:Uncharacterized protein n=1 Tax=Exocentrus adspersus TaxID=1586481 RepID=A0AAV8VW95_9CUCU|nr:hypothetical protein NQ315_013119 [Exocentrus adspersus]
MGYSSWHSILCIYEKYQQTSSLVRQKRTIERDENSDLNILLKIEDPNISIRNISGTLKEELGPHFFNTTLNGDSYLNFLQQEFEDYFGELPLEQERNIVFQQDGAPPHSIGAVTDYLNQRFHVWIGRNAPIKWPPNSPDLTPLDTFLWGTLKDRICSFQTDFFRTSKPDELNPLRNLCYPGTDVFMLCFSIVKPSSFISACTRWADELTRLGAAVVLVGTQADLKTNIDVINRLREVGQRPVLSSEAKGLAERLKAPYVETSALACTRLKEAFDMAIVMALERQRKKKKFWKRLCCIR